MGYSNEKGLQVKYCFPILTYLLYYRQSVHQSVTCYSGKDMLSTELIMEQDKVLYKENYVGQDSTSSLWSWMVIKINNNNIYISGAFSVYQVL